MAGLDTGSVVDATEETPQPALPIKKSVLPGHIVCLEDGKKFKTLKRHLRSSHGMDPAKYRARWSLPPQYPMTAPDYTTTRSILAKTNRLGQKHRA
jgi:predicted transcriptional regulator